MSYLIQVNTERAQDGCFRTNADKLDDNLRAWIKDRAASFRAGRSSSECKVTILRNGDCLANARVLPC